MTTVCTLVCVCVCVCVINNSNLFRGESVTVQKGKVSVSAWMDRKVVMVMSSSCQPDGVGSVLRRQQDGSRIPVTCPSSATMNTWGCGSWRPAPWLQNKEQEVLQVHFYLPAQCSYNQCLHSHEALLSHVSLCQYQELPPSASKGVDGRVLQSSQAWSRRDCHSPTSLSPFPHHDGGRKECTKAKEGSMCTPLCISCPCHFNLVLQGMWGLAMS